MQPANILISLQASRDGVVVIPKSVSPERIASAFSSLPSQAWGRMLTQSRSPDNFNIVELTEEEIAELQAIDKEHHFRACHPSWTGFGSLGFPDCK